VTTTLKGMLLGGRYRIGDLIGQGGMSAVYAAEDLRLARVVAVKLLACDGADSDAERLFREAKAAARAQHPAVVTVFGFGSDDALGLDYLAMEYLEGEDLAARIRAQGALAEPFVVRLGAEIADALAAVHATGVVHRDLKPANIFLARRGLRVDEVKLLDFGVARHSDMQTLTAPGQLIGTLRYMAPEQLRNPRAAGPRSDIYALGVTLYEALTAESPYRGRDAMALTMQVGSGVRVPLLERRPETSASVRDVVERCLALDPAARFSSARTLCEALLALA
jgi:eukaryotic-like serine/threonine-protein kinase